MTTTAQVTYGENIKFNNAKIGYIHDVSSLAIGAVAAVLNLQSIEGFLFFFATSFIVDCMIYGIAMVGGKGKVGNYFDNSLNVIFFEDYSRTIFSFVMMWTLVLCLVS